VREEVLTWFLLGRPEGKRPLGREDNIKMGLQDVSYGYGMD
jgi:hypothetical protein